MSDDTPAWALELQRLTDKSGLTQAEVARRAGLNRDAYGRYYLGRTRPPARKLIAIARAFGVKPSDIDPERPDLDSLSKSEAASNPPYRISPGIHDPEKVFIEIAQEVSTDVAMQLIDTLKKDRPK